MSPPVPPLYGARRLRLCDLTPYEAIRAHCACGQVADFSPGELQRLYQVSWDLLIHRLQPRLHCAACGETGDSDVSILDTRKRGRKRRPPPERLVVRRQRPRAQPDLAGEAGD